MTIPVYEITTRNNETVPEAVPGNGYGDKYQLSNFRELLSNCPAHIAIFVHGWGLDETQAKERIDRMKMSLDHDHYFVPLVGFSWESKKEWELAKLTAADNGPKLAHFILDFMNVCKNEVGKDVTVSLIAHSMGARVVLSALNNLHMNQMWNNNNFKISTVHLMGAAVDDEEVSRTSIAAFNPPGFGPALCSLYFLNHFSPGDGVKTAFGNAITEEVVKFYNLINPEDNVLQFIYPCYEAGDDALGLGGKQEFGITPPPDSIYQEINVKDEIKPFPDADGIDEPVGVESWDFGLCNSFGVCFVATGDNHAGYIGFRNSTNPINVLADDGAMNKVVDTSPPL
jgi:hypothetical protein